MPFFVVLYGSRQDHPLHPPYYEPPMPGSSCEYVNDPPRGAPLPDGGQYRGFTVSGARFARREEAEAATEQANAAYGKPTPYTIVEAPDEPSVIALVSGKPVKRWLSVYDAAFREPVRHALEQHGELLLYYERHRGAGTGPYWFLVHDLGELDQVLERGRRRYAFEAFLEPQLPLRGTVDEEFARQVQALRERVMEGDRLEFLLLAARRLGELELDANERDTAEDVDEWLQDHWGRYALVGRTPTPSDRRAERHSVVGYTPDEYGNVRAGAY